MSELTHEEQMRISAVIAEKVMGWTGVQLNDGTESWWFGTHGNKHPLDVPNYFTDGRAACELLKAVQDWEYGSKRRVRVLAQIPPITHFSPCPDIAEAVWRVLEQEGDDAE